MSLTRELVEKAVKGEASVEEVMAAHGQALTAATKGGKTDEQVQAAITAALADQKTKHDVEMQGVKTQLSTAVQGKADLQKIIDEAPDLDEKVRLAVEEANTTHAATLKEEKKNYELQVKAFQRDSETVDFLRGLKDAQGNPRVFVTPETELIFRQKLNEALQAQGNEGKNRADLFNTLTLGADGKERTDIYAGATQQGGGGAAGGHGGKPPTGTESDEFGFTFNAIRGRDSTTTT